MRALIRLSFFILAPVLVSAAPSSSGTQRQAEDLRKTYAQIAYAAYADAETGARKLLESVWQFQKERNAKNFEAMKYAWLQAREAYGPTEVFRFADGPIEEVEGRINAWPLDEAYLDYVQAEDGSRRLTGLINQADLYPTSQNTEIWTKLLSALYTGEPDRFPAAAERASFRKLAKTFAKNFEADFSEGTVLKALLTEANELGGEENVSLGYHAIEFLLWGQDLSLTTAGQRPWTDYLPSENPKASAPYGERRMIFLKLMAEQLVEDLAFVRKQWSPGEENYRKKFESRDIRLVLETIQTHLTQLLGFELAGERLFVAYDSSAQEDEHSCFSDNTHRDVLLNIRGVRQLMTGDFKAVFSPTRIQGTGWLDLVRSDDPALSVQLADRLTQIESSFKEIFEKPNLRFDQIITAYNVLETPTLQELDDLLAQSRLGFGAKRPSDAAIAKARLYIAITNLYDQSDLIRMAASRISKSESTDTAGEE